MFVFHVARWWQISQEDQKTNGETETKPGTLEQIVNHTISNKRKFFIKVDGDEISETEILFWSVLVFPKVSRLG